MQLDQNEERSATFPKAMMTVSASFSKATPDKTLNLITTSCCVQEGTQKNGTLVSF